MTREEIIDGLEIYTVGRLKKARVYITVEELQKFIDAIKTLQEPCADDVISREAALKCFTLDNTKADAWNNIKALPPVTSKLIECEDCVSRQVLTETVCSACEVVTHKENCMYRQGLNGGCNEYETIMHLPPVTTPAEKVGKWQRISDYRYQCSRCGNVVHFSSEENLYRFSRWCGKCGSNNDRGQVE